jgi:hypothetical protein
VSCDGGVVAVDVESVAVESLTAAVTLPMRVSLSRIAMASRPESVDQVAVDVESVAVGK